MKIRPMTFADGEFVREHSAFKEFYQKEPSQMVYSVAVEQDNDVIAVGGLVQITRNTAWAWCEITTFVENHKIELVRLMREYLDMMVKELRLSRLQAWIDPTRPEAIRLICHLGFIEEYEMKDFLGPDKPAMLYMKLTGAR
jgi:hypothetical protein